MISTIINECIFFQTKHYKPTRITIIQNIIIKTKLNETKKQKKRNYITKKKLFFFPPSKTHTYTHTLGFNEN